MGESTGALQRITDSINRVDRQTDDEINLTSFVSLSVSHTTLFKPGLTQSVEMAPLIGPCTS